LLLIVAWRCAITAYNFGIGTVIGRRTDVSGQPPSFFGTIQDISVDIDQTLVELYGQLKLPADIAPSKLKISGKAKYARLQLNALNNMLLGNTVTSGAGFDMAAAESHTFTSTTTTVTVTNGSSFIVDLGVFYNSNGVQLTPTTATPTVGQYIPGVLNTGTYTFNTSDVSTQLNFYYTYTVTTLFQMIGTNNFMGTGPIFELTLSNHYTNNLGVKNTLNLRLNACRSSRFTFPFSNVQYTIPDFDFMAFADSSGNWGTIATTE
jgi:hypothetical protein